MASPPTGLKALNAKHYIVAALTATVAAAVVVTVFFVVLSPARIYFSVTKASSYRLQQEDGFGLNITLTANNTSQRAAVKYQSLFVDVGNNTKDTDSWYSVRANIMNKTDMPLWHPHGSLTTINATAILLEGSTSWKASFAGDDNIAGGGAPLAVQLTAAVRFKVAGIKTRLYAISVRCGPITFEFVRKNRVAHATPVDCSPF